jgi:hypothetical protein
MPAFADRGNSLSQWPSASRSAAERAVHMQTQGLRDCGPANNNDQADVYGDMPDLPSPSERRWTIRRKAAVIEAVRAGWVPIEEVCRLYTLSVEEFLAWGA